MKKVLISIIACFISFSHVDGQEQNLSFIKCEELRDSVLCYIQSYRKEIQGLSALWLNFDFDKYTENEIEVSIHNRLKIELRQEKQFLHKTDSLVLLVTCWPDSSDYHSIIDTTKLSFYNRDEYPYYFFNQKMKCRHWVIKKGQVFWAYDDASKKTYDKILQGKKAVDYMNSDLWETHVILFYHNSFIIARDSPYDHCVGRWYEKDNVIYLFDHKALHISGQFLYDFMPDDFSLSIPSIFEFKDNRLVDKTMYLIPGMEKPKSFDSVYLTDFLRD